MFQKKGPDLFIATALQMQPHSLTFVKCPVLVLRSWTILKPPTSILQSQLVDCALVTQAKSNLSASTYEPHLNSWSHTHPC